MVTARPGARRRGRPGDRPRRAAPAANSPRPFSVSAYSREALPSAAGTRSRTPSAINFLSLTVSMFLATPRLFSNSPNRLLPANASQTISIDRASPAASSDRATGHASCSKLLCFMVFTPASGLWGRNCRIRLQDATTRRVYPLSRESPPGGPTDDDPHPDTRRRAERPDRSPADPVRGLPRGARGPAPEAGGGPPLRGPAPVVPRGLPRGVIPRAVAV